MKNEFSFAHEELKEEHKGELKEEKKDELKLTEEDFARMKIVKTIFVISIWNLYWCQRD